MTITFDNEKKFYYIYRYVDGAWDTNSYANSDSFDLFSDTSGVDDIIYFGLRSPSLPYHSLKFYIGTGLVADSITIVWEYYKSGVGWTEIPGVTDDTNSFQNTGENWVTFPVPEGMSLSTSRYYYWITVDGARKYGIYVRARITAVTNLTEGGAQSTQVVKLKDWTITATDEASLTMNDLYDADVAGSWGVVEKFTSDSFLVKSNLCLSSSHLTSKKELIQIGRENYPSSLYSTSTSSSVTLGELDAAGKGKNGVMLMNHTRFSISYTYIYNFQAFGSVIDRKVGAYGAMAMSGVFKFVDSVFNSDNRLYLASSIAEGSEWIRSVYADPDYLYLYSPHLTIDNFKTLDSWTGILCGGSAVISNTDINFKTILRYYGADVDLVNCTNIDKSELTSGGERTRDLHTRIKYSINLKIVDEEGNPINNSNVVLTDTNGDETFSVSTDGNGEITEQTVMVYDKWWEHPNWNLHEDDYNDFTLTISKAGYNIYEAIFTLNEKTDWTIALNDYIIPTQVMLNVSDTPTSIILESDDMDLVISSNNKDNLTINTNNQDLIINTTNKDLEVN